MPGAKVESSRDLAAKYGVAPMTVHQAIRMLRDEGLVNSFQGRGVFVRSDTDPHTAIDLPARIGEIQQQLDDLAERVPDDVQDQITDLRRQMGLFQAQLIDLYARTGHAYPHGEPANAEGQHDTKKPRRANSA